MQEEKYYISLEVKYMIKRMGKEILKWVYLIKSFRDFKIQTLEVYYLTIKKKSQ